LATRQRLALCAVCPANDYSRFDNLTPDMRSFFKSTILEAALSDEAVRRRYDELASTSPEFVGDFIALFLEDASHFPVEKAFFA